MKIDINKYKFLFITYQNENVAIKSFVEHNCFFNDPIPEHISS